MIIGDPYKFCIFINAVKEWNIDESVWINGVLLFFIDGSIFTKEIFTATLNSEITPLKEQLMNIKINSELFEMEKERSFIEMHNITFPSLADNIDNDYCYSLSPTILIDFDCYVYAVSNGKQIRIMGAKLDYIKDESRYDFNKLQISEAFITYDELNKMIYELDILLHQLVKPKSL